MAESIFTHFFIFRYCLSRNTDSSIMVFFASEPLPFFICNFLLSYSLLSPIYSLLSCFCTLLCRWASALNVHLLLRFFTSTPIPISVRSFWVQQPNLVPLVLPVASHTLVAFLSMSIPITITTTLAPVYIHTWCNVCILLLISEGYCKIMKRLVQLYRHK